MAMIRAADVDIMSSSNLLSK